MICSKCNNVFPDGQKKKHNRKCPECLKQAKKEYDLSHIEKNQQYRKEYLANHLEQTHNTKKIYRIYTKDKTKKHNNTYHQKIKQICMEKYSVNGIIKCQKCGYDDLRALSIDHIEGGGTQHRKSLGGGGSVFYKWLKKNNYPTGYQVLCMNCNFIKKSENNEYRKVENENN